MRGAWQAISLALAVAALGCTGRAVPPAKLPTLIRRPVSDLPKVGKYEPPLDGSRLEVAPPEGWIATNKGQTFLVGFKTKDKDLPRITVNAEDPPPGCSRDLTKENADSLVSRFDDDLNKAKKMVKEYSLPVVLGDTWFIRHVRQVKGRSPCVVQSLQTIKNGRMYTVELIVEIDAEASEYGQSLRDQRDFGYAVAANMRLTVPGAKLAPPKGTAPSPAPAAGSKAAESKSGEPKTTKPSTGEAAPASKSAEIKAGDAKTAKPVTP